MTITKIKSVKCSKNSCKNLILDTLGKPTKHTNEGNSDYCKDCACDHSFNCDDVCEYCGEEA